MGCWTWDIDQGELSIGSRLKKLGEGSEGPVERSRARGARSRGDKHGVLGMRCLSNKPS
jgi:hypothetical protein